MKILKIVFIGLVALSVTFAGCLPFGDKDDDQLEDLPQNIVDYINQQYPDYEIDESEKEVACTGEEVYEVELEASDDSEIELTFDLEGSLLYTETEIKKEELPQAVTATIASDYGDYKLEEAERLDLSTDEIQYEVELEKGKTELSVLFSAGGTVLCEETEDD